MLVDVANPKMIPNLQLLILDPARSSVSFFGNTDPTHLKQAVAIILAQHIKQQLRGTFSTT